MLAGASSAPEQDELGSRRCLRQCLEERNRAATADFRRFLAVGLGKRLGRCIHRRTTLGCHEGIRRLHAPNVDLDAPRCVRPEEGHQLLELHLRVGAWSDPQCDLGRRLREQHVTGVGDAWNTVDADHGRVRLAPKLGAHRAVADDVDSIEHSRHLPEEILGVLGTGPVELVQPGDGGVAVSIPQRVQ